MSIEVTEFMTRVKAIIACMIVLVLLVLIGHRLSPPLSSKPFSVDMWVKGLTIINSDYSFQSLCYS